MNSWTPHPILAQPTAEQAAAMDPKDLKEIWARREELIRLEREDPFNHGFSHENTGPEHFRHWRRLQELIDEPDTNKLILFGGNRSLHPE